MSLPNNPYWQRSPSHGDVKSVLDALVQSKIDTLGPPMLVRVEAVHGGGVSLTGRVDVLPLIQQHDALGRPHPREILYNVPYLRIQGGTSALIVDPNVGDIGFVIVSGRDQSNATAARAPAPPASRRTYSLHDCVYVGGFLNDGPNQYIHFTDGGIRVVTPGKVEVHTESDVLVTAKGSTTVQTAGSVQVTAQEAATVQASHMTIGCNLSVTGTLQATGDIIAGSVSLTGHVHDQVQPGKGKSGKPI